MPILTRSRLAYSFVIMDGLSSSSPATPSVPGTPRTTSSPGTPFCGEGDPGLDSMTQCTELRGLRRVDRIQIYLYAIPTVS